jgi:hypothetical protein
MLWDQQHQIPPKKWQQQGRCTFVVQCGDAFETCRSLSLFDENTRLPEQYEFMSNDLQAARANAMLAARRCNVCMLCRLRRFPEQGLDESNNAVGPRIRARQK